MKEVVSTSIDSRTFVFGSLHAFLSVLAETGWDVGQVKPD